MMRKWWSSWFAIADRWDVSPFNATTKIVCGVRSADDVEPYRWQGLKLRMDITKACVMKRLETSMCWGVSSTWSFKKDGDLHILTSLNCCISTPILKTWNGNPFLWWDYSRIRSAAKTISGVGSDPNRATYLPSVSRVVSSTHAQLCTSPHHMSRT
jgi:hypothetical protein